MNIKRKICSLILLASLSVIAFAQNVNSKIKVISPVEGSWCNKQMLIIDTQPDCEYFYSLSGSDPEAFGFIYDGPVLIDMVGEVELQIKMSGKTEKNGTFTESLSLNYTVVQDEALGAEYSAFISYFFESGVFNYTSGTDFYIPETLYYSLGLPPDSFIQGDIVRISAKSVLSRNIPCTIWDTQTDKKWRFIIKTFPQSAGVFSRRDVPFYITDWDTITFTNDNLIYKIDSEYWSLPKESRKLDRSVSHMISWQDINYEMGNPVEFFVLPVKPELVVNEEPDGAVSYSVTGDESYRLSLMSGQNTEYQELFSEIGVDTFYGDNVQGKIDIGFFSNSVYQGQVSQDYRIIKRPPSEPVISSSASTFYSRESVTVDILGEEGSDLYVSVSEPFPIENSTLAYLPSSQVFKDVVMQPYTKIEGNEHELLLKPDNEGAFYYRISAYSKNSKNTGKPVEYSVIIDEYNYYFDAESTAEYSDGTVEHPFKDFASCVEFINKGRYACLHVKGNLSIPAGQTTLLSNLTIYNDEDAVLIFPPNSSVIVKDSTLSINKCRIQMENNDFYTQNKISPLFKLERSMLDIQGCQASVLCGKNGAFADCYSASVNIMDSIISVSANSYALCVSGVKTKLNIQRSSVNVTADTSVIFSINEGDIIVKTNSFKVIGQKGRIAELFGVYGNVSDNFFKSDLDQVNNTLPIYKDQKTSITEVNNENYGF